MFTSFLFSFTFLLLSDSDFETSVVSIDELSTTPSFAGSETKSSLVEYGLESSDIESEIAFIGPEMPSWLKSELDALSLIERLSEII